MLASIYHPKPVFSSYCRNTIPRFSRTGSRFCQKYNSGHCAPSRNDDSIIYFSAHFCIYNAFVPRSGYDNVSPSYWLVTDLKIYQICRHRNTRDIRRWISYWGNAASALDCSRDYLPSINYICILDSRGQGRELQITTRGKWIVRMSLC